MFRNRAQEVRNRGRERGGAAIRTENAHKARYRGIGRYSTTPALVANAIILPMSAWLSRVFGRKR